MGNNNRRDKIKNAEHIIRNDLQMLVSMMNIESSGITDPEIKAIFTDCIEKIAAIADEIEKH